MANPYYEAYLTNTITLCKTLVIKFDIVADSINKELELNGYSVSSIKSNWKYYMNIAGEYHFTDEMMYITSLDTLEKIEFTKDNLRIHRATANAFTVGSVFYNNLLSEYPNQRTLIKGIINPVDKDFAISCKNGTVLYYDRSLVESQEMSLIKDIEDWIHSTYNRWFVKGYAVTDEYYITVLLSIIFSNLLPYVLNLRLARRGTNEVNSFHIQQRLASNGRLDRYMDQMTLKQKLFLYRNIKYIKNNVGKEETFDVLLKNIITERNLPLARYDMYHTVDKIPDEILPDVQLRRVNLNSHPGDGSDPERTLSFVMSRQEPIARGNRELFFESYSKIYDDFRKSTNDRLRTKVLESALLDTTNSVVYSLEDILLNHWGYLVGNGLFNSVISVLNPYNGDRYQLQAREGYILYLYLYHKARGFEFETTPVYTATSVLKRNLPTASELYSRFKDYLEYDEILDVLGNTPTLSEYLSIAAFKESIDRIYRYKNEQRIVVGFTEDFNKRAMRDMIANECYHDVEFDLYGEQDMQSWLTERDISVSDLDNRDLDIMASSILELMSGGEIGVRSTSLQEIQRSMLNIMRDLSSYSVQYIRTINSSNFRIANVLSVRGSNPKNRYRSMLYLPIADIGGFNDKFKVKINRPLDIIPLFRNSVITSSSDRFEFADLSMHFSTSSGSVQYINANIGTMHYSLND